MRGGRVPVTARLSRRFYDVFGEEIANELVDWFNAVDSTYRGDLRELNEINFARFDAKLEQRLAQLDAKWTGRWTELEAKLDRSLAQLKADLLKWMFAFWAPTALATTTAATGHAAARAATRRATLVAVRHHLPSVGQRCSSRAANPQGEGKGGRFHAVAHSSRRSVAPPSCANSAVKKAVIQKREYRSPSGPRNT